MGKTVGLRSPASEHRLKRAFQMSLALASKEIGQKRLLSHAVIDDALFRQLHMHMSEPIVLTTHSASLSLSMLCSLGT